MPTVAAPVPAAPTRAGHRTFLAGLLVLVASMLLAAPAHAAGGNNADRFVVLANDSRSSFGLPAYRVAGDLGEVAARQAQRMAVEQRIFHNPNLQAEVPDWDRVGENVGVGASPEQVHEAFMNSPSHRHVILADYYVEMGVGTATGANGRLYVSEVFRLRPSQVAAVAPAPEPSVAEPAPADIVAAPTPGTPLPAPDVAPVVAPVVAAAPAAPAAAEAPPTTTAMAPSVVAPSAPIAGFPAEVAALSAVRGRHDRAAKGGVPVAAALFAAALAKGVLRAHMRYLAIVR
jgi:uncharacterized protein YkwD